MAGYEFRPMLADDLPEVAKFLNEQQEITSREDSTQARPSGDDLLWMLKNPDWRPGSPLGETLRAPGGKLVGMIIAVPRLYRLGDQKRMGLAAGHFFIDSSARMQGLFMLRRFFKMSHGDFWFANSCNRQSGPIWAKLGAVLVPESDVEYLYPFRYGPLAQELAVRKQWPSTAGTLLRWLGPGVDLLASLRIPRNAFQIEYTNDLEKLAAISDRNRNLDLLQPERSVEHLKWQHGTPPPSPDETAGKALYTFSGMNGVEGWFSLANARRGGHEQIRCASLLDVVWPESRISFAEVLPAILAVARRNNDLLSIRGRVGLGLSDGKAGLKRRTLLAPEGFLLSQQPASGELVRLADLPFIDRY
jgi:hypothetical protein